MSVVNYQKVSYTNEESVKKKYLKVKSPYRHNTGNFKFNKELTRLLFEQQIGGYPTVPGGYQHDIIIKSKLEKNIGPCKFFSTENSQLWQR